MSQKCAKGVIVFSNDKKSTVIVTKDKTNHGFPKGGIKKNETFEETALRELFEETGIKIDQIDIVKDYYIDDFNAKGNLSVRYLIGKLKTNDVIKLTFDPEELSNVQFYTVEEATKLLSKNRATVLQTAHIKISQ